MTFCSPAPGLNFVAITGNDRSFVYPIIYMNTRSQCLFHCRNISNDQTKVII